MFRRSILCFVAVVSLNSLVVADDNIDVVPLGQLLISVADRLLVRLGMDIVDEASAVSWLDNRLSVQPTTEAELIPDFNRLSSGARIPRTIGDLLKENFRRDPRSNVWRVPTALEREALNDAGAEHRRRRVHRVAEGGADAMTALELLELAEEAVKLGLYADAGAILVRIHHPDLSQGEQERSALTRYAVEASLED